jgi:hypothetical protein
MLMKSNRRVVGLLLLVFAASAAPVAAEEDGFFCGVAAHEKALSHDQSAFEQLGRGPGSPAHAAGFVENKGQWADDSVRFALRKSSANMLIYDDGMAFELPGRNGDARRSATVKARFIGANEVAPEGIERSESVINYFCGSKERWRSGVSTFNGVAFRNLYDGIDLFVRPGTAWIKMEFHVSPGADWRRIAIAYQGIDSLLIDEAGRLVIAAPAGTLIDAAPTIYQDIEGKRVAVAGHFSLLDRMTCGFELTGTYDPAYPLIIDPYLEWSTYLGGKSADLSFGITVDAVGNAYVTGFTWSTDFPTTNGWDMSLNGSDADVFVSKLSADGQQLVWSTYLGGSGEDWGVDIALDSSGDVYITGFTRSSDFPTVNGLGASFKGGERDAFLSKFSSDGQQLLWSSYIGGDGDDMGHAIAIGASGNGYVAGFTSSSDLPTTNGFDMTPNGCFDGFVLSFSSDGRRVLWSNYLGGSNDDHCFGMAIDGDENVYLTGCTKSQDFPATRGWDMSYNGYYDVFVSKVSHDGQDLFWSTFMGGGDLDWGLGIAVDSFGNAYVTGVTRSTNFPTTTGSDQTFNGGESDAFVSKFSANGSQLLWSTYHGGNGLDQAEDIALQGDEYVWVTGYTYSSDFPTPGGLDTSLSGGSDAFVSKFSTGSSLLWSTYFGGSSWDEGWSIAADRAASIYVMGDTYSSDFPTRHGWDSRYHGAYDAFVAKFSAASLPPGVWFSLY